MPKALEQKLSREAHKKGLNKEKSGAYVYGTMNKLKHQLNALKGAKRI
jgi:hypothetical protein